MRELITVFDERFLDLHTRSAAIIQDLSREDIFRKPRGLDGVYSCGEYILRSAGKVEQTFGGITSRLWDDPFEWTLPEELSTAEKISEYLEEVEVTRQKGFDFVVSDDTLRKTLTTPEKMQTIFELFLTTIITAEKFHQMAVFVKHRFDQSA